MDLELLQQRAAIIRQVRAFFDSKNYLELDTPLFSRDLIPESCLEVFETTRHFPRGSREKSYPLWLIPSPEIHMKKIISKYKTNAYQICKCFRNGESEGHLHSSEFTMLEYYTMNASYMDSLALTEELISNLFSQRHEGTKDTEDFETAPATRYPLPATPFERITVARAFERWAGFDLFAASGKAGEMERQARILGIDPMPGLKASALYDLIFIHAVEPHLKGGKPVALLDYPAFVPCLAKKSQDGKTFQRWELYYNGIEMANCFTEETDPGEVKCFFENEAKEKEKTALVKHNIDQNYWKIFNNFPNCSGVAMGLDRLIMALAGKSNIEAVLPVF